MLALAAVTAARSAEDWARFVVGVLLGDDSGFLESLPPLVGDAGELGVGLGLEKLGAGLGEGGFGLEEALGGLGGLR